MTPSPDRLTFCAQLNYVHREIEDCIEKALTQQIYKHASEIGETTFHSLRNTRRILYFNLIHYNYMKIKPRMSQQRLSHDFTK